MRAEVDATAPPGRNERRGTFGGQPGFGFQQRRSGWGVHLGRHGQHLGPGGKREALGANLRREISLDGKV